jgi:GTP-binding protein YchF
VTGDIDPIRDIEIINTELILADIEVLERGKEKLVKMIKSGDKHAPGRVAVLERIINHLNGGKPLSTLELHDDEKEELQEYGLITNKPVLYLANSDESGIGERHLDAIRNYAREHGSGCVAIIGKLEEEISKLSPNDKQEFLNAMGLKESGLDRLIHEAYRLLDLLTYYTAATDLQAWTVKRGTPAVKAAGKIHTDFERGFIRAEVYNYKDLAAYGTEHAVKEKGLYKSEGKEYIIQEGDIVKYLFNV